MALHQLRLRGNAAELLATEYLIRLGYTLLVRNFSWRGGEIDIILEREQTIVCVEVKARRIAPSFFLSTVVGFSKQRKIILTAQRFMNERKIFDRSLRFDIILVWINAGEVHHIPNAFTAPDTMVM